MPQLENLENETIFQIISGLTKRIDVLEKASQIKECTAGEIKQGKLHKTNNLDAGQDIFSNEDVVIEPRSSKLISTNLYISIPQEHVGLIWSRSGLSVKHKIEVGAGCIDIGYTGEVKVHLYNLSDIAYNVKNGDKIAQLLTIPINLLQYKQVNEFTPINSNRNNNGYGSTGK